MTDLKNSDVSFYTNVFSIQGDFFLGPKFKNLGSESILRSWVKVK